MSLFHEPEEAPLLRSQGGPLASIPTSLPPLRPSQHAGAGVATRLPWPPPVCVLEGGDPWVPDGVRNCTDLPRGWRPAGSHQRHAAWCIQPLGWSATGNHRRRRGAQLAIDTPWEALTRTLLGRCNSVATDGCSPADETRCSVAYNLCWPTWPFIQTVT